MSELQPLQIEQALAAVGELLAAESERIALVVVGGATLSLLGIVPRTTSDVDVIARADHDAQGSLQLAPAEPFPPALRRAIRTVARDYGLDENWMNSEVAAQWAHGLPPGILNEMTWRNYGVGLEIGLVGRRTLIALKLFAAADSDPGSVHAQDLVALSPTDAELDDAAAWVRTQDEAESWPVTVQEVMSHVRRSRR